MGTTSDKLSRLLETKREIKEAIIEKGVAVQDDDVFADYPEKILAISGGVDKMWAKPVNGETYTAGDKGFLTVELRSSVLESEIVQNYTPVLLCGGDDIFYRLYTNAAGCHVDKMYRYDYAQKIFVENNNVQLKAEAAITNVRMVDGELWGYGSYRGDTVNNLWSYRISEPQVNVKSCFYAGEGVGVQQTSASTAPVLGTYDILTDTFEKTGELPGWSANYTVGNCYVEGNILYLTYSRAGSNRYPYHRFYDISDKTAPVLLNTNDIGVTYAMHFTGLKVGDCLFCSTAENMFSNDLTRVLSIYHIKEGYVLEKLNMVYTNLFRFVTGGTFFYNPKNKMMTFGRLTEVGAYRVIVIQGALYVDDVNFKLDGVPEYNGDGPYFLTLSDNMKFAAVSKLAYSSGSYFAGRHKLFALNDVSGGTAVYKSVQGLSDAALSGFATGNVDEQGNYEFETVAPKSEVVWNIEPEPDLIEIYGGID